jgi:hypothetical protein
MGMDRSALARLEPELRAFLEEFRDCAAAPTRRLISAYVRGQLGPLERKSVRPMAIEAGIPPRTLQELLSLHKWDDGRVKDLLLRRLRRERPVLGYLHESAASKRGDKTPGVERQANPETGRTETCCVFIHLGLAEEPGRCLLGSALYLPRSWTEDARRRVAAGLPEGLGHRTRGELALDLVERASAAGHRFEALLVSPSLAADEGLLSALRSRGPRFVAELPPDAPGFAESLRGFRLDHVSGTEGLEGGLLGGSAEGDRRLALRRRGGDPAWFLAGGYPEVPVPELLDAARRLQAAAEGFARARREIGLSDFEVRVHRSLDRHLVLSSLSLAFLAETRSRLARVEPAARRQAR